MAKHDRLPADPGAAELDALRDDLPRWREPIERLAAALSFEPMVRMSQGTVLVALLGRQHALKRSPPFLRDHFEFEAAASARVGGRLSVPTPLLRRTGDLDGWPWLLMTQLHGESLTAAWPSLDGTGAVRCWPRSAQ